MKVPKTEIVRLPILEVRFFRTETGTEPVRDWLKSLTATDRKAIGEEIKTVQFGWPLGMPLVRKVGHDLWEVRIRLEGKAARVIFTEKEGLMVLLHGFIKKSNKIPKDDLELSHHRLKELKSHL